MITNISFASLSRILTTWINLIYFVLDVQSLNSRNNALETPLHLTALRGNIEGVKLLIEYGVDIDAKTSSLETPLQFAAKSNQFKVVKLLLEYGATLNAKNVTNMTSIELSLASMCFESFKTILDFGHTQSRFAPTKTS